MNNLTIRTITGIGFIVLMLGSAFLGQLVFSVLFLLVVCIGTIEFLALAAKGGDQPSRNMSLIAGIAMYILLVLNAMGKMPGEWLLLEVPVLFLIPVTELWRKKPEPFRNIGWAVLSTFYIALPSGLLIYFFNPAVMSGGLHYGLLVGYFVILWVNDTGAYVVGSLTGRHRLFERISPKKSWEGSVGGAVFAVAAAYGFSFIYTQYASWQWLVIAILIIVFGTLGDLVESMLKRSAGVKDSGSILPGHGGILDRFDAVLVSVPFVFVFLTLFC